MNRNMKFFIIVLVVLLLFSNPIYAANVSFRIFSSGIRIEREIKSKTEIKFHNIVKQKYDVSCGSAALATIFQYYYDEKITEQKIIDVIKNIKNISTLENSNGFTLLDLKMAAEFLGYKAYGYKGSISAMKKLDLPKIVLLNSPKGDHFVVIKNIGSKYVEIADPALGNIRLTIETFKSQWNNTLLAVESENKVGSNNFSKFEDPKLTSESKLLNITSTDWIDTPVDFREF